MVGLRYSLLPGHPSAGRRAIPARFGGVKGLVFLRPALFSGPATLLALKKMAAELVALDERFLAERAILSHDWSARGLPAHLSWRGSLQRDCTVILVVILTECIVAGRKRRCVEAIQRVAHILGFVGNG